MPKVLKEGAVDNKKKRKYCAESKQWISFRHWKAHKDALKQVAETDVIAAVDKILHGEHRSVQAEPKEKTWQDTQIGALEERLKQTEHTLAELRHKLKELGRLRDVVAAVGRVLNITYGDYGEY